MSEPEQIEAEELVEAERMATVGRLSLKVAHEVRNPIAAIELNAELLGDMVQGRVSEDGTEATKLWPRRTSRKYQA